MLRHQAAKMIRFVSAAGERILVVLQNLYLVRMTDIQDIAQALREFSNARDWDQFHNPKDLALAISIEAGELLEQFLWKDPADADPDRIKQELADVFSFAILLANKYNWDVKKIVLDKLQETELKYPVEKAKGTAKKYNEL
ncbi:nucleotide pyrophosphohydrolase [Sediminibacterium soli]|uniref:nucleotide pyrophosphohydrolase n=1 Tax=Sediminibacterium soli TaxID=2698829 RepID=UPI001F340856|nr:nucleotide pyrophosphohydrolase [Sediminibacterium soli]